MEEIALFPLIDSFPPMELSDEALPAIRAGMMTMLATKPLPDLPVVCREILIPSGEGDRTIRCLKIQPIEIPKNAPAILHFHGGGHVIGMPEMNQPQLMQWADELQCLVLSVDYRLAPETPYPGPMDDGYAALSWLHGMAAELGIDPHRIAVAFLREPGAHEEQLIEVPLGSDRQRVGPGRVVGVLGAPVERVGSCLVPVCQLRAPITRLRLRFSGSGGLRNFRMCHETGDDRDQSDKPGAV